MDQVGFSLLNPGTSLNFDLPVTSGQEEDDAEEDERIKEKELQDLLTNAFDDLIDDDDNVDNEEDRSSFIDDHDSQCSNEHSYRKYVWDAQQDSKKPNHGNDVSLGSERSVKFQTENSTSLNSNGSINGNEIKNGGRGDHPQNDVDWERRYYLDEWDREIDEYVESDGPNSANVVIPNINGDIGIENSFNQNPGTESIVEYRQNGIGGKSGHSVTNEDDVQRKFLAANKETSSVKAEIEQLRILYAARGREIERLQEELDASKNQASKEFQILRRYLAKTKEEKEECSANLDDNRNMLNAAKQAMSRLEGESRALEIQLKSVSENRDELLQRLQAAESTIESLQAQFKELSKSENMVRAREHHVTILNSMKDKHNNETYELKVQIDQLKDNLVNKEEIVNDLKRRLSIVEHDYEQTKMERAETVNRLIKTLEESQREYQRLVKAGDNPTSVDDEVIKSLKHQLSETKRELELYVTATELQIVNAKTLNKAEEKAKHPNQDGLVGALKSEVERSLACLQAKNEQLQRLQAGQQNAVANAKLAQEKLTFAEEQLKNAKKKIDELNKELNATKTNKTDIVRTIKEQLERMESDKRKVDAQLTEKDVQLCELEASKKDLNKLVRQLKEELASLSLNYEDEGRKAVEACRDACLKLHDDAIAAKHEMMLEQVRLIKEEYTLELKKLCQELDDVKDSYVKVCVEKDEIERRLFVVWNAEKAKEIEKLMVEYDKKKNLEMQTLREKLHNNNDKLVSETERKIRREFDNRLSDSIKEVKQIWEREQDLVVQEKVLTKVKEELHRYMSERSNDARDNGDQQVEQIQRLEERVKESEAAWKKQLTNLKIKLEEDKKKAMLELSLRKDQLLQKRIQEVITEKSKEKELALVEAEAAVAAELDIFLGEQKDRFVTALQTMQTSHAKEKADILNQCETKMLKLREDYDKLMSSQSECQRRENSEQALSTNNEVNKLRETIAKLEAKCESNACVVAELNSLLRSKSDELEEIKSNFERNITLALQEQHGPLKNDAAVLKKKADRAEVDAADFKARFEEWERKHKTVESKYRTLKDKMKKYHRYIHAKEREFAETLTKLLEGNTRMPNNIASMKSDVIAILDARIRELQFTFMLDAAGSKGFVEKDCRLGQVTQPKNNKNVDQLRIQFGESIQKIHDDVLTYLENCSQKATKKIQEEVATATWLMAERVDLTKTTVDTLTKEMAPEQTTTTATTISSGRGTMACSSTQPETGEIFRNITVKTLDAKEPKDKWRMIKATDQYWSSTPFNNNQDPVHQERHNIGLTDSAKVRIASPNNDKQLLSPSPDTISTGTWNSNGFSSAEGGVGSGHRGDPRTIPEKLSQIHRSSHRTSSDLGRQYDDFSTIHNNNNVDDDSQLRKALFKTFANELAHKKSEFWINVDAAKDRRISRDISPPTTDPPK